MNKKLLEMIPFFHGLYARTKDQDALVIAKNLGIAAKSKRDEAWLAQEREILGYNPE